MSHVQKYEDQYLANPFLYCSTEFRHLTLESRKKKRYMKLSHQSLNKIHERDLPVYTACAPIPMKAPQKSTLNNSVIPV